MTSSIHSLFCILVAIAFVSQVQSPVKRTADKGGDKVLFTKSLEAGVSVRVIQGLDRGPLLLSFLKPATKHDSIDAIWINTVSKLYELRVELKKKDEEPLVLASNVRHETNVPFVAGVEVYDCLVDNDGLLFAMSQGQTIGIWEVNLGTFGSRWHVFSTDKPWDDSALMRSWSERNLRIKLSRGDGNRLVLNISEGRTHSIECVESEEKSFIFKTTKDSRDAVK